MKVHQIIDAIHGRARIDVTGRPPAIREFEALYKKAELFDFGSMHLEPMDGFRLPAGLPAYKIPQLTRDEEEFWHEGLIPLPAPVCWFEFKFDSVSGILVRESPRGIEVTQVDFGFLDSKNIVLIDGIWTSSKKSNEYNFYCDDPGYAKRFLGVIPDAQKETFYVAPYELMKYLVLMINSRTTEITRKTIPEKLNRARVRDGKTPLKTHSVVDIVPLRFRERHPTQPGETRSSPRLHWRRSHARLIKRADGTELKIVIARMLVGRRELGEVTHEYRIKG